MNDITIYRPYKVQAWTLPFTVTVGVFAFVATGYCVPYWGYNVLILAVIGIVCAWLTKVYLAIYAKSFAFLLTFYH